MRLLRATILGAIMTGGAAQLTYGLSEPNPAFYQGSLHRFLDRRGTCGPNQHSCLDINGTGLLSAGLCCNNTQYCMIDTTYAAVCCDIGSNCALPCASSEYVCKGTASTTISGKATAVPTQSCCARRCPQTSNYLCPSSLGGGCCAYDSECLAGGKCGFVPTSTSNGAASSSTSTDTSTSVPPAQKNHGGLSTGAKAGIGGGIAVLGLVIAGLVLYFCVCQRRRARQRGSDATGSAPASSQAGSGTKRPPQGRRQTSDYFGPEAKAGPYTDASSPGISSIQKGVPISPQAPDDIAVPVEIDSGVSSPGVEDERLLKSPTVREYPIEMP